MEEDNNEDSRPLFQNESEVDRQAWNRQITDENQVQESENNSDSFSMDNQGRKLSKEQQEYFKDSKVRDENNNLLTMYQL